MTTVGRCACDNTEPHPVRECTRPGATVSEVFVDDVRGLLDALGLGTHARPYSAHAVIHRDVLPAIYALHMFATDMINAPEDSAADWGYDLAHRLGMLDVEPPRGCTCLPAGPTCDVCESQQ